MGPPSSSAHPSSPVGGLWYQKSQVFGFGALKVRLMSRWLVAGLWVCAVAACTGCASDPSTETDQALRRLIQTNGLTGDPAEGLDLPSIDDPVAVLGRKLFFSKSLGGDYDSACVSCHHPVLGGGDGLALSIGVGADDPDLLGPGRAHPDGELTVPRNAPTTFNIALWEKGLFWDSRVELLDAGGIRTPDSDYGIADRDAGREHVRGAVALSSDVA